MVISIEAATKIKKRNDIGIVFIGCETKSEKSKLKADGLDKETLELLTAAEKEGGFSGAKASSIYFRNANSTHKHIIAVGLGDIKKLDPEELRIAGANAYKALKSFKGAKADLNLDSAIAKVKDSNLAVQALTEGLLLADYSYDDYKTNKKALAAKPSQIRLLLDKKGNLSHFKKSVDTGTILAECTNYSKWLGDTPGNLMTPDHLAKSVLKESKGTKLKVTIWDKARIKKENFGGLLGVSLGSAVDPRFIIMEYNGSPSKKDHLAFVGKGLTFDCGGISIKPSAGMDEMKYDMCGGANVIGALLAIAKLGLKINVKGYVPSTENMPGPLANKPGDILTFRNGKTAHVDNTDAEGRLILADALAYASEKKPKGIIDAATLTGACVIALGNSHSGIMGTTDTVVKKLQKAAEVTGEKVWPLPLIEDHLNDMKGKYADLNNISSFRGAGSSTAGAFLSHFVGKDIPWAHCDIAGTAWNCSNRLSYCQPNSATGAMVRTFVEVAKSF